MCIRDSSETGTSYYNVFVDGKLHNVVKACGTVSYTHLDVDVPGGKYLYQLAQNILHELHGLLVAAAEYVGEDTPVGTHLIRAARAAELRIGGKHGEGMTGQVYLRQHVNVCLLYTSKQLSLYYG